MFWDRKKPPAPQSAVTPEAEKAHRELLLAELTRRQTRIDALEALLAQQPWVPKRGISGGTYHSDPGTDSSWEALDTRIEQEASAFRTNPGYKAILDLLEARLLGVQRLWRATDDPAQIATLHIHARVYEDMIATLENKTSLRERKETAARMDAKAAQERERLVAISQNGRSPFLR